jgi:hypothetical protein
VDSVRLLSEEYVKAFVVKTRMKDLSLDDKRKRYFYLLNSSGLYHDLKEKLKVTDYSHSFERVHQSNQNTQYMLYLVDVAKGWASMLGLHSYLMIVCLCGFYGNRASSMNAQLAHLSHDRMFVWILLDCVAAAHPASGAEALRPGPAERATEGRARQHALLLPHGAGKHTQHLT